MWLRAQRKVKRVKEMGRQGWGRAVGRYSGVGRRAREGEEGHGEERRDGEECFYNP